MAILHQVALRAHDDPAWESLRFACAAGDTVVLLDTAVVAASALATLWAQVGVRICVPRDELAGAGAPPESVEIIDDDQWWRLVADHELIQHWM